MKELVIHKKRRFLMRFNLTQMWEVIIMLVIIVRHNSYANLVTAVSTSSCKSKLLPPLGHLPLRRELSISKCSSVSVIVL